MTFNTIHFHKKSLRRAILLFLLFALGSQLRAQDSDLTKDIAKSVSCVKAEILAVNQRLITLKIDSVLYGNSLGDTVVFSTSFIPDSVGEKLVGDSIFAFLKNPSSGYLGLHLMITEYFTILNDSVEYKGILYPDSIFQKATQDFRKSMFEIAALRSLGKINAPKMKEFRRKSSLHALLITDTSDYSPVAKISSLWNHPIISLTKMNVLYLGVDNPINIGIPIKMRNKYIVTTDNGTIRQNGDSYIFIANTIGIANICIYEQGKDLEQVTCKTFRVIGIPAPVASVGGAKSGIISKAELCAQRGIYARFENYDFDMRLVVLSFTVEIIHPHSESVFFTATDWKITEEMRAEFAKSENGTAVVFQNIFIKVPSGEEIELGIVRLKIID